MSLTYAIADTHGRFDLLCAAISAAERDAGAEGGALIVLGDFIDRGPQARSIIELLMAGPALPNWEWIVLQGNHESMMLTCISNPHMLMWWLRNGGGRTLESYGYRDGDHLEPLKIPEDHLIWLSQLPVIHEDDRRIFVHAGVPHNENVADCDPRISQWMLFNGDVDHDDGDFYPDLPHCSGKHLVHGHHQSAAHPLLRPHRTNLDSFAWYTGRLAIGVFNDERDGPVRCLEVVGPQHDAGSLKSAQPAEEEAA